jgi:hypothetical protein
VVRVDSEDSSMFESEVSGVRKRTCA